MVVTGTSRIPETFKANPTLLRPPLPSQCPTESREVILPHPVLAVNDCSSLEHGYNSV